MLFVSDLTFSLTLCSLNTCCFYRGYSGLRITYADFTENISVSLSARFGTVSLSPMLMEFWQGGISVSRDSGEAKELILQGRVEAVNSALESFQYLGYSKDST